LSPDKANAKGMIFGLRPPSKETTDRKDWQARAMPDEDRQRLFAELGPVLRSAIGHKASKSDWWPCYVWLPTEILNWDQHMALNKIAHALGIVKEPDLIAGKKLDDFLIHAFRAVQQVIVSIIEKKKIDPVPE